MDVNNVMKLRLQQDAVDSVNALQRLFKLGMVELKQGGGEMHLVFPAKYWELDGTNLSFRPMKDDRSLEDWINND